MMEKYHLPGDILNIGQVLSWQQHVSIHRPVTEHIELLIPLPARLFNPVQIKVIAEHEHLNPSLSSLWWNAGIYHHYKLKLVRIYRPKLQMNRA